MLFTTCNSPHSFKRIGLSANELKVRIRSSPDTLQGETKERFQKLWEQVAIEKDPERLLTLAQEIDPFSRIKSSGYPGGR